MEYIITIVWTFQELSILLLFADTFFEVRKSWKATACAFCVTWLILLLYFVFGVPDILAQMMSAVTVSLFVVVSFRGALWYQILVQLMSWVFIGAVDTTVSYGICTLMGITYHELMWKKLLYVAVVTTIKCVELLVAYLVHRFCGRRELPAIRVSWLLLSMLFPAVSLDMLLVVFLTFQDQGDLAPGALVFSIAVAVANVAILYLIQIMEKRTREEEELHLMNQQMEIQTKSILALERSYRSQRSATHEFQNQLQTISDLLSGEQYAEAKEYLRQLQTSQTTRVFSVNTHHPIMDAILNQKYQLARESGIDIQLQVNDLSGIRMETDAMVVLFCNLLDNAIEACQRLPGNRVIRCSILASDDLYVSIKNTSQLVTVKDGMIPTSKPSREEHGFGLLSIRRILDGFGAEYSFRYHDGWFQFAAEIPR